MWVGIPKDDDVVLHERDKTPEKHYYALVVKPAEAHQRTKLYPNPQSDSILFTRLSAYFRDVGNWTPDGALAQSRDRTRKS
jgi:hypothetical protein